MKRDYKILIIDDTPENLKLLVNMLTQEGYQVKAAPNGKHALAAIKKDLPDLILLDIIMPEMNGFEVCQILKKDKTTCDIPVIFLTALDDVRNKVLGFKNGGADYITKPYQVEEILARVHTHLEVLKSKREIQNILSNTFINTIKMMSDIIVIRDPSLHEKIVRLRKIINFLIIKLSIKDPWNYDLAIMLSHIGLIAFPNDIIKKISLGEKLTETDKALYEQFPSIGANLIMKIPRLQKAAEMIRNQNKKEFKLTENLKDTPDIELGAYLIRYAKDLDYKLMKAVNEKDVDFAIRELKKIYHPAIIKIQEIMIDNLYQNPTTVKKEKEPKLIKLKELTNGMIIAKDILTKEGDCLLLSGSELTESIIALIDTYYQLGDLDDEFYIN